ncbi:response regulator [Oceanidesulfovibrio marinus]|uniref:Response regulator n=1 Tax=Oceanidesulfovibrio marinus TaxID=370038 RepID=A0ABX6NGC7_9BACT|nr:response regulator [Oceanidesulfovibrio marinus]QJT09098.1 response regulator [Oceanidesulfovibrio marinus]
MAHILIVEDETSVRAMLRESLAMEGYEVDEAANGREGLAAMETRPADVVVTDIHMPEQEGLQFIKDLRQRYPETKIVAISGGAPGIKSGCNLELASMFGAHITCAKPVDIDALLMMIRGFEAA